jgi:holliday junction DNA helicase RuvA
MICKLKGRLEDVGEDSAVLGINGISYEVHIPGTLSVTLKRKMRGVRETRETREAREEADGGENWEETTLYVIDYIEMRGGHGNLTPRLIGFLSPVDKEFFETFTQVSGFGVKKALKSLTVPVNKVAFAIETGDVRSLAALPGIGKRTADKIVAELKGKVSKFALQKGEEEVDTGGIEVSMDLEAEAQEVLLQLGYRRYEAEEMIRAVLSKERKIKDSEELIKEIFKEQKSAISR